MNHYKYLLHKNRFLQSNAYNLLPAQQPNNKKLDFFVNKLEFVSSIALTELNLVKAHRRFLLRSFIEGKDSSKKDDVEFIMRGIVSNRRKVFALLTILNMLGKAEFNMSNSKQLNLTFSNILLKLKHLDLYKANIKALSTITVYAELNERNKNLINEIFST